MTILTQNEKALIAKGYAIPGMYAASKEKRDEAHAEWVKREMLNQEIDKRAAPHF